MTHLDEEIARRDALGHDTSVATRVRASIQESFAVEVEALKQEHGIA